MTSVKKKRSLKENYSSYETDACIVATHMMLEATNVGIDNIWIAMFDNEKYDRSVYNAYINSVVKPYNNKNRMFTTFDYYPTTLAALGFNIDGNRLGLGTNLFSSRQTLAEELGDLDKLDDELSKNSKYYNNRLLGDSYKHLKEAVPSE